jgi:hypothetical protein
VVRKAASVVGNATGVTNLVNCVSHPAWGQCLEAAAKIGGDVAAVATGGASEGLEIAGEEAAEVAAEDATEDIGAESVGDRAGATCESFTASTKVLLASGAAVPIASLTPGDKVLATNSKTGKTQAEPVTAVMVHHDTDLYNVTIRAGHRTAVIHTTRNHLFWDVTTSRWTRAAALRPGDHLRAPSRVTATVVSGRIPTDSTGWMWDLSVPGGNDHDFYIDTVAAAVLVHNCPTEYHPIRNMVRRCLAPVLNAIMTYLPPGNNYPSYPPIPTGTSYEWRYQRDTEEPKNPGEGGEESGGGEDDECAS